MYIRKDLQEMQVSVIRTLAMQMRELKDGINLTIGEPADDIPVEIKEYMSQKLFDHIGYGMPGGLRELRIAYANHYNTHFEADYDVDECYVNAGSTEAFSTLFSVILEKDDEVILPLPIYPGYEPNIVFEGAKPVFIGSKDNHYEVTAEILEKHITPKTKLIVLTTPNNPLGTMIPLEEMDKIVKLIEKHNIYLMSDEIYSTLVFKKFHSFARYTEHKDKIIIINGMSKSHSMTGYRVGFTLTNKKLTKELIKMSQYKITCANVLAQYGSLKALELFPEREDIVRNYKQKIDYLNAELTKLGFDCYKPDGAFYVFADYRKVFGDIKSLDLAQDLIDKVKVGVVPSIAFRVEGAIRISVNKDMKVLTEFIERMKQYIKEYRG